MTKYVNLGTLGLSNDYEVGDDGSVRSGRYAKRGEINLKPFAHSKTGRMTVEVRNNLGQRSKVAVARLVLSAFVGKKSRAWHPAHKNGDITDCQLSNLRWIEKHGPTSNDERTRAIRRVRLLIKTHDITLAEIVRGKPRK